MSRIPHGLAVLLHLPVQILDHLLLVLLLILITAPTVPRSAPAVLLRSRRRERSSGDETRLPAAARGPSPSGPSRYPGRSGQDPADTSARDQPARARHGRARPQRPRTESTTGRPPGHIHHLRGDPVGRIPTRIRGAVRERGHIPANQAVGRDLHIHRPPLQPHALQIAHRHTRRSVLGQARTREPLRRPLLARKHPAGTPFSGRGPCTANSRSAKPAPRGTTTKSTTDGVDSVTGPGWIRFLRPRSDGPHWDSRARRSNVRIALSYFLDRFGVPVQLLVEHGEHALARRLAQLIAFALQRREVHVRQRVHQRPEDRNLRHLRPVQDLPRRLSGSQQRLGHIRLERLLRPRHRVPGPPLRLVPIHQARPRRTQPSAQIPHPLTNGVAHHLRVEAIPLPIRLHALHAGVNARQRRLIRLVLLRIGIIQIRDQTQTIEKPTHMHGRTTHRASPFLITDSLNQPNAAPARSAPTGSGSPITTPAGHGRRTGVLRGGTARRLRAGLPLRVRHGPENRGDRLLVLQVTGNHLLRGADHLLQLLHARVQVAVDRVQQPGERRMGSHRRFLEPPARIRLARADHIEAGPAGVRQIPRPPDAATRACSSRSVSIPPTPSTPVPLSTLKPRPARRNGEPIPPTYPPPPRRVNPRSTFRTDSPTPE